MYMNKVLYYSTMVIVLCCFTLCIEASVVYRNDDETDQDQNSQQDVDDIGLSLDELLGLDEKSGVNADEILPEIGQSISDTNHEKAPPISKMFLDAIEAMKKSSEQLHIRGDTGILTQRFQEEAIKKLTILIEQAQQKSDNDQQKPSSNDPPPDPGDLSQKQSPMQQKNPQSGENKGSDSRPPVKSGQLDGELSESRSEWGQLPERIRDVLIQGRSDKPANLYRRLTESYYKRLADESKGK